MNMTVDNLGSVNEFCVWSDCDNLILDRTMDEKASVEFAQSLLEVVRKILTDDQIKSLMTN